MLEDALFQLGIVSVHLNTSQTATAPTHPSTKPTTSWPRMRPHAGCPCAPARGAYPYPIPTVILRPAQAAAARGAYRRSRTHP